MNDSYKIVYNYRFNDGTTKTFTVMLDKGNLALVMEQSTHPPLWALLNFNKCTICPLDESVHTYCPIAVNLAGIAEEFKDRTSLDRVSVSVAVEERSYFKATTVQHGLSPLLGIIMTTSGCPIMDPLRPMVRFHLPFASLEETVFRMVSMYLVAQFLRNQEGKTAAWNLDGLAAIYADVGKVNKDFAKRMHTAAKSDANVNALVNLDVFATMVPRVAEDMLKQIKPYFYAHLK